MPEIDRSSRFAEDILKQIGLGHEKFLFWGLNKTCLEVLDILRSKRKLEHVVGIIDSIVHIPDTCGIVVYPPSFIPKLDFDSLVIFDDALKASVLVEFSKIDIRMPLVVIGGIEHLAYDDSVFYNILSSCERTPKAGGYPHMLIHIYQSLVYLVASGRVGAVAEFGVFEGGTTAFIAKTLLKLGRRVKIYGFDTFEGF